MGVSPRDEQRESLHSGITRWAAHAPPRLLIVLSFGGLVAGVAVLVIDAARWPAAALFLSTAAIATWGLVARDAATTPTAPVAAMLKLLIAFFWAFGAAGLVGVLFWMMGQAPTL